MKNLFLTIVALFIGFAVFAQQPENYSFEDWEDVGLDRPEPINWSSIKTSDGGSWINGLAPYVWDQSTDAHTGTYSVKLITKNTLIGPAPGTVTNGRIHATLSEGWAFTDPADSRWNTPLTLKPDSIVFWAKHSPAGADNAQVKALLHTGSAKIPDAAQTNYIAWAEYYIPDATPTWTRFSAPFTYYNDNEPEYILMVLSSGDDNVATVNTESWFDDVELVYVVILEMTVFLEGPYLSGNEMSTDLNPDHLPLNQPFLATHGYDGTESVESIPADVVDWVLIEIRDAASAELATVQGDMRPAFLKKDGSIITWNSSQDSPDVIFNDKIIYEDLFVVVHHRNHLSVMSGYSLTKVSGKYTYDFSDAEDKIYGGAAGNVQLELFGPGLWGMISGDGDANKTIEMEDKTNFWSILVGKTGYLSADYNLDGLTTNIDKNEYWLGNLTKESQVPN